MKTKLLTKKQYEKFAKNMLPKDWKFTWVKWIIHQGEEALGICKYNEKEVKVVWKKSLYHEDLARTIIHEITHVILGKEHIHDKVFWSMHESLLKFNIEFIHGDLKKVNTDGGLVLYHGTSTKYLNKILKEGIKPRVNRKSNWELESRKEHVYLTSAYPVYFGIHACSGKKDDVVVIKVQLDENDVKELYPDEDFIGQCLQKQIKGSLIDITKSIELDKFKEYWKESLEQMGNVSYKGIITLDKIVDYRIIEDDVALWNGSEPSITVMNFYFYGNYYIQMVRNLFNQKEKVLR